MLLDEFLVMKQQKSDGKNTLKFSLMSVDGENQIEQTKIQKEYEKLLFRFMTDKRKIQIKEEKGKRIIKKNSM